MTSLRASSDAADAFATVEEALESIRDGKFVVVVGVPERRSECAVTIAAEHCTTEAVSFMLTEARGMMYLALTPERSAELGLQPVAPTASTDAAFMAPVDARDGVSTGISAADRSHTIRTAAGGPRGAAEIVSPGHVYPIRARSAGVLERQAHTEAAVDLPRLAGLTPAGVLCGVLTPEGDMAVPADLGPFCRTHGIRMMRIHDLVEYRRRREALVERAATVTIPTPTVRLTTIAFHETLQPVTHLAFVRGAITSRDEAKVTVHVACPVGHALRSLACDCRARLDAALAELEASDSSVLVYLGSEPGTSLARHLDDPQADARAVAHEAIVEQILANLIAAGDSAELEPPGPARA